MMELTKEKIEEYARKYDESYRDTDGDLFENEMKVWLKDHRYLDKERFVEIGRWKSKRPSRWYERNDDSLVREITRFSFTADSEEAKIKSLLVLSGVSYRMASTILHFAFPDKYSIMDFRALWSLGWEQPKAYNFAFWQKYCEEIKKLSAETGQSLRTVDKALWEYSKRNRKPKL